MESKSEFVLPLAFSGCFRTAFTVMIGFSKMLVESTGNR
jgi:hypothetical protein